MSTNGKRRPPRPEVIVTSGGASPGEAAAIAAGLERFLAVNAATAAAAPVSRWQRRALLEGVRRTPGIQAWGLRP